MGQRAAAQTPESQNNQFTIVYQTMLLRKVSTSGPVRDLQPGFGRARKCTGNIERIVNTWPLERLLAWSRSDADA